MFPNSFKSLDGLNLWCYGVQPPGIPRAQVIVVHGLGDHCRSMPYRNLSEALLAQGFAAYGFDLRGHGQSEGPRMYAEAWTNLRDDLKCFVQLVREYTADPHFQTHTTPRLAAEALRAMQETRARASSLSLPLLILHGEADTIVRPEGSADFFARVQATDKYRQTYPDAYHNLFLEPNRTQVFADIGGWLERRC